MPVSQQENMLPCIFCELTPETSLPLSGPPRKSTSCPFVPSSDVATELPTPQSLAGLLYPSTRNIQEIFL